MPNDDWTTEHLPDLTGTTAVITGANSGIGLAAARALAAHGSHVVLAVRDQTKGADAARSIDGSTEVRRLDLADLASVREFADGVSGDIRLLINNAGIMAPPLSRTADGFELQFGTNHLGHFALTNLLLPRVTGRVVTVSSLAHQAGRIDLGDPNWTARRYRRWEAYGQSKLANLLFTLELQRRLVQGGSPVLAVAAHPGWAATNLQSHSGNRIMNAGMALGNRFIGQTGDGGALPTLFAATADVPGNSFSGPSGRGQVKGPPVLVDRSAAAKDRLSAQRLWELSEDLTGIGFPAALERPLTG